MAQSGARIDQVLAVVQRQQQPTRPKRIGQRLDERAARFLLDTDDRRYIRHDQLRLAQVTEPDEPHPVRELVGHPRQDPQSQPGLPDATRPAQRYGMPRQREPAQLAEFALTSDEAVRLLEATANLI